MSKIIVIIILIFSITSINAQNSNYSYEPNLENPFGIPNPDAPSQITDWEEMIGECYCKSVSRNADGSWADTVNMLWRFKYILNGFGVQDETLKEDGLHSGSIRQFNPDSSKWFVHYYSSGNPAKSLATWKGTRIGDQIVLYNPQKAPNGMDGYYKITFSDIRTNGFNWLGEWVNENESISYPTWKIFCTKNN